MLTIYIEGSVKGGNNHEKIICLIIAVWVFINMGY